jgi:hypothetical protein
LKKTFKLVLAILFLLTSFVGHAQIISAKNIKNRLIHRAGQRAEEKATQKVEEGIDKVFDSLFETPAQKKKQHVVQIASMLNPQTRQHWA